MSNQDKERAEFEAWYRSKYGAMGSYEQWSKTDVIYLFVVWQASAERYQSRIAELESDVALVKELFGAVSVLANSGAIAYDEGHPECALWSSVEMQALCEAMKGGV